MGGGCALLGGGVGKGMKGERRGGGGGLTVSIYSPRGALRDMAMYLSLHCRFRDREFKGIVDGAVPMEWSRCSERLR